MPDRLIASLFAMGLVILLASASPVVAKPHESLPEVDGFPSQPIRVVVYTSPGGLIDVTARRFARLAQEHADHPFAVINRPGGGGIVAFEEALREPADGHRILAVTRSNISKMVATGREDLIERINWHAYLMDNAHVLITNAIEGPGDWHELKQHAQEQPGSQLWLGVDIGGVKHVSGVKIAETTGIDMRWIPYASGGEAVAALLGNLGTAYLGNPRDALASERLRVVAVAAENRLPDFPDAPTFAELGYTGLEDELIWRGLAFRKGVPDEVRDWYRVLIGLVTSDPRWESAWTGEAVNLRYRPAEEFERIVASDREEFRRYLGDLGLLPEARAELSGLAALRQPPGVLILLSVLVLVLALLSWRLRYSPWREQAGELSLLAALSACVIGLLLLSTGFPPANPVDPVGAGGLPRAWMLLALPLIVVQGVMTVRHGERTERRAGIVRLGMVLAMFGAYLVLLPVIGYLLASAVYLPLLIWYLGYRRLVMIAVLTVAWLVFSELVFQRLLHVDLPRFSLWR